MSAKTHKKSPVWKLSVALTFLAFSAWLTLGPMLEHALSESPSARIPLIEEALQYGGYESPSDLLGQHSSYEGDPGDLNNPFHWFGSLPNPGPGGIASLEVRHDTGESAEVVETRLNEEEDDPIPQLEVRIILRTKDSSRVLVDGQILGVGDSTRAGKIVQILDSGIETMYRGKKLFFALSPR